jgi:hypothetical protein
LKAFFYSSAGRVRSLGSLCFRHGMGAEMVDISADYVRSILDYDPETGASTWKSRTPDMFAPGARSAEWRCRNWNSKRRICEGVMIPELYTTLILADFRGPNDHKEKLAFHEAVPGLTIDDAVSEILSGEKLGFIRAGYVVKEGEPTRVVSEEVADRIAAAWIAGLFVSPMAREFVDFMGGGIREAAE